MFSTSHTGAATAISRDDLATLPTVSGRLTDIIRMSPQYGGQGTFAGQDNRANNITVESRDGEVILRGTVRSWAERHEAERVAWSAAGVRSVENEIVVRETGHA